MQALFEMNEGRKRLREIIDAFPSDSPHWNEAQNRFQFIDRLLTECLGWEREYMTVESTDDLGGRADYVLAKPPKGILEAKREAVLFNTLPYGKPAVVRKLSPLMEACDELKSAVHQIIPYCSIRGVPIAIICNGPQLVIFQAFIFGQSPLDGECYLFNGFDSYLTNFNVLWRLLSPEGIAENRALRELGLHRNPRIPPKASSAAIPEPTQYRYRSPFQEDLRMLASLLLEEVEDDPRVRHAFYEQCYVRIEANNRHLLLSRRIIAHRYGRVTGDGSLTTPIDSVTNVDASGSIQIDDPIMAMAISARPVVVVGDVGVGKTSFFENLFETLDSTAKANTYFIHLNLGSRATMTKDVKTYVLSEIPKVLLERYDIDINSYEFLSAVYFKELKAFDNSAKGQLKTVDGRAYMQAKIEFLTAKSEQLANHLLAALGHLAHGRNRQIIAVVDNADQRSFEIQQEAFLIAQELAGSRSLLVFVALRPSTFYQSKLKGALSGYQNRVFTISPPPADEVLSKRIAFAVRVAEGQVGREALDELSYLEGIKSRIDSVIVFLKTTLRAIRSKTEIKTFLSNIAGGNTRLVIELFTAFCGSPNVDSEKIVRIEEEQRSGYDIPLHEFTKHALLGDYAYYNPQSSLVACNIFDVSAPDPREHFVASLIVAFCSTGAVTKDNDGFVAGTRILEEMSTLGFSEDQIRFALRRLAEKRLIETPHAHYREVDVADSVAAEQFHYRVTSIGVYHVRFWMTSFAFIDATSTDTPIFDSVARGNVFALAASFEIDDRYRKSIAFRAYLEQQWQLANINTPYFDFAERVRSQEEGFLSVERAIPKTGRAKRHR
jgi:hypothetical protein